MCASNDQESPRRVRYARSPSPVQKISYTYSDDEIRTPQRKRRTVRQTNDYQRERPSRRNETHSTSTVFNRASETSGAYTLPIEDGIEIQALQLGLPDDSDILVPRDLESYEHFLDSVRWDEAMIIPVTSSNKIFVVQGWNIKKHEATSTKYHLSRTRAGESESIMCECPLWKIGNPCFHEKYLREHGEDHYPITSTLDNHNAPFLVSRIETATDNIFHNVFSAPRPDALFHTIKNRAIVEHIGQDNGDGSWSCSKDLRAIGCPHIKIARRHLELCLSGEESELSDRGLTGIEYPHVSTPNGAVAAPEAVSYVALDPPLWARIKTDPQGLVIAPMTSAPDLIPIDEKSTCCCRSERLFFDSAQPVSVVPCIIYSIAEAWSSQIETQKCPGCIHRRIGPDAAHHGLFNFNNRLLFTHELMNDYTSTFTSSETPFAAYVQVIRRRYIGRQSAHDFVTEKVFIAAWFSFISLMKLDNDMTCSLCGPTPKVTIWDGVTLAFNRRHILQTLRPPTTVDKTAPVRDKMKPAADVRLIVDKDLRKTLRLVLDGPPLRLPNLAELRVACADDLESEGTEDARLHGKKAIRQRALAMTTRLDKIPHVIEALKMVNHDLGALFDRHFGRSAISHEHGPLSVYVKLFRQIAAEESALQLVNISTLNHLKSFFNNPCELTASNLALIPALHQVVEHELSRTNGGVVTSETLGLCRWLFTRAFTVFKGLCKYGVDENDVQSTGSDQHTDNRSWRQTGAYYSLPEVRQRPSYPGFPNDSGRDNAKADPRGEGCNKFYSKYGESRLTGGIMGVWCTHSICYGFHCIPSAEGRNDVFSAIYTRWKTAPRMVVYDFACALQPYCMAREPEYFANTVFVIDSFHSTGHTKCGHATFLDTYCSTNPLLLSVNSSAAESGNGGISRIRKSVSYMSQGRAIIYTKVFLSIWNRARIRASEAKS